MVRAPFPGIPGIPQIPRIPGIPGIPRMNSKNADLAAIYVTSALDPSLQSAPPSGEHPKELRYGPPPQGLNFCQHLKELGNGPPPQGLNFCQHPKELGNGPPLHHRFFMYFEEK